MAYRRHAYIIAGSSLAASILPILTPLSPLQPFTPRGLIHSHSFAPFVLSAWAPPTDFPTWLSRGIQITLILSLPAITQSYGRLYLYSLLLASIRTVVGYILSRAVGWAYPHLFSHWALYEPMAGFGPPILLALALGGQEELAEMLPMRVRSVARRFILPILTCAFCLLEHAPWTYGLATLLAVSIFLIRWSYRQTTHTAGYTIAHGSPGSIMSTESAEDEKWSSLPSTSSHVPLQSLALALLAVLLPYLVLGHLAPPERLPFPASPNSRPLLDIVVLSYPRPVNTFLGTQIISATLESLIPYLSPNHITLSAFTHSPFHPAFDKAQRDYPQIPFYTDSDIHPHDDGNQYLHLAEAFRWAYEREGRGEWVMLVEDDFPLCGGDEGWAVVATMMAMLEGRRVAGAASGDEDIGSGMIGTGGSGLIIHHSRLPLLSRLLRTYSSRDLVPSSFHHPPPDIVVQDCLIGRKGGTCERDAPYRGKMVIASRLVLDHIGGMATTTIGKQLNSDKWRCGWRSGLHGEDGVDVLVV